MNKILYISIILFYSNSISCQETIFELKNNAFKIFESENLIYTDSVNFFGGSCSNLELFYSNFQNQFYIFLENNCTTKTIKQLYQILWKNKKFVILKKEYFEISKNNINSKIIYYDKLLIDSLKLDEIETSEKFIKQYKNCTPIYYQNKSIGKINQPKKEVLIYEHPIFNNYENIINAKLYNDIAFILYKNSAYDESIYILKIIINKFPTRTVAYLNIADCYWETNEKEKAIENYKKYVQLMKAQKKDLKKIPKYVYERIK